SSDVCSSDLRGHQGGRLHQAGRDEVAERPAGSAGQAAHGWGSLGQVNVRRSLFLFLVGLLIASGCASTPQGVRGPPGRPLEGAVLRLASTMGRALVVEGRVGPHAARVHLDVTKPRTLVTEGCLRGVQVVQEGGRVSIPDAFGEVETVEELALRDLSIGGRRLAAMQVGLRRGEACEVWLGLDVLSAYALEWEPLRREIRFSAPL